MGAPTGNRNAVKHGRRSKRIRAERMAAAKVAFEEDGGPRMHGADRGPVT